MSQSHRISGGPAEEAFKEQCVLSEIGASIGLDFYLYNFQGVLTCTRPYLKKKKKMNKA